MDEGMDHDDKYRMVEDEFLSTAQKFTVHLHTAEYKRRERDVKARRAEAISSISRPVTGKMPDHTKRKLANIDQAKTQRAIIQDLVGKKAIQVDDSDDELELPYVGTTLHGLMDSPRKMKAPLGKLRFSGVATTRAAAGYQKPVGQSRVFQGRDSESPKSKAQIKLEVKTEPKDDSMSSSMF